MDLACTEVGVDAPTLKRWLALGEAAYLECEVEDPHCRFFEAFVKALEYADQAVEADRQRPVQPEPQPPPRSRAEPRRTQGDRVSEAPSLVGLVVEEAPIEIVIGSRPPWIYETAPEPPPVRSPEPPRPTGPEEPPSESTPTSPDVVVDQKTHRDPTFEQVAEALGVLIAGLVVLIAILVLVLAVFPIALACFTLIRALRLAIGLAYSWRAGLIAMLGGTTGGFAIPGPVTWTACARRTLLIGTVSMDRTSGSVALADRLRPQRE